MTARLLTSHIKQWTFGRFRNYVYRSLTVSSGANSQLLRVNMETRAMRKRNLATSAKSEPLVVGHDKEKKEFYIRLFPDSKNDDKRAFLQYRWVRNKYVDLYHTLVPEEFRGKGVAKILAEAALDHFAAEDVTMKLTCTYLQYHIEKYPVPRILCKIDWSSDDE